MKVAIEFCLQINATYFLFTEILQLFQERQLEQKFLACLEPFILAGQFKKEQLPESVLHTLVGHYQDKKNFKVLEKIIQQLDFSNYSMLTDLIVTCEVNCLISALLYLKSSQAEDVSYFFKTGI